MNKIVNNLKISALIILGGLIIPALLSILFSGFRVNVVSIVSFEFFVGIILAVAGGVMISHEYSTFKKKIIRSSMDEEIESDKDPDRIPWPALMFSSGMAIVIIAIAIGEIF